MTIFIFILLATLIVISVFSATKLYIQNIKINTLNESLNKIIIDYNQTHELLQKTQNNLTELNTKHIFTTANLESTIQELNNKKNEYHIIKQESELTNDKLYETKSLLAISDASNKALQQKIDSQKQELVELRTKFTLEFENIANKILESKSEKFIELNKQNLNTLLTPLENNINEFKKQVNEVYHRESKERFSLSERVKELAILNQQISNEAKNLTKALKGDSKTQGRWGEMILESILEKSGLRKNEQYFIEYQLHDDKGNSLLSDAEQKKMRPDAVIKYPDNRDVIIDAKVSLNAFSRSIDAHDSNDLETYNMELQAHVGAIKAHVNTLSNKAYDDYMSSLDFVLMFIPSEAAYMAAIQQEPDLWNYAYDKRILLISPTNLIISLKLILDLWKREYQTKNTEEIVKLGSKLHDKFVNFIDNIVTIGKKLDDVKEVYDNAYKQLYTGKDNLIKQSITLKQFGIKNKKELPTKLIHDFENQEIVL